MSTVFERHLSTTCAPPEHRPMRTWRVGDLGSTVRRHESETESVRADERLFRLCASGAYFASTKLTVVLLCLERPDTKARTSVEIELSLGSCEGHARVMRVHAVPVSGRSEGTARGVSLRRVIERCPKFSDASGAPRRRPFSLTGSLERETAQTPTLGILHFP